MRGWSEAEVPLYAFVYARRGCELMGCKSPVCESRHHRKMVMQTLAEGKGETVRFGLEEAGVQSYEPPWQKMVRPHGNSNSGMSNQYPKVYSLAQAQFT